MVLGVLRGREVLRRIAARAGIPGASPTQSGVAGIDLARAGLPAGLLRDVRDRAWARPQTAGHLRGRRLGSTASWGPRRIATRTWAETHSDERHAGREPRLLATSA